MKAFYQSLEDEKRDRKVVETSCGENFQDLYFTIRNKPLPPYAKMRLTPEEIQSLLTQLDEVAKRYFLPRGMPIESACVTLEALLRAQNQSDVRAQMLRDCYRNTTFPERNFHLALRPS